MLNIVKEF